MKLTLHIGTEKTGTTSIQAALATDRARLADRRILFPKLFGSPNQMELSVAAVVGEANDEVSLIELNRQGCGREEYRRRLIDQIACEIAAGSYSRIVVSNEHCHSRLNSPAQIRRLVAMFPVALEDVSVVVYLRRQDRLAVSLYSTILKLGGTAQLFPPAPAAALPLYYDFETLLALYAGVVDASRLIVRLYEPAQLYEGDVVRDFYRATQLGIEPSATLRANESLSRAQAAFLQSFNKRFPIICDGKLNTARGPIFAAIQNAGTGAPFRPSRAEAEEFYSAFSKGNARVRHAYFPDLCRNTLFDEKFSDYPDTASPWELEEHELFEFVEAIWRFKHAQ